MTYCILIRNKSEGERTFRIYKKTTNYEELEQIKEELKEMGYSCVHDEFFKIELEYLLYYSK